MAEGRLWQDSGPAIAAINSGIAAYLIRKWRMPVVVSATAATLGDAPAEMYGVRIVRDETIQPGCYMFCAEDDGAQGGAA